MKLKLIKGIHVTPTEKQSIKYMLQNNLDQAVNGNRTKRYDILRDDSLLENEIKVRVGSYATYTIGAKPEWRYNVIRLQVQK